MSAVGESNSAVANMAPEQVQSLLNDLTERVNQLVVVNFALRKIIKDEMKDFNVEKLNIWLGKDCEWGDLPDKEKLRFSLPERVNSLFQDLKNAIRSVYESAQNKQDVLDCCASAVKVASREIYKTDDKYYEHLGLTESPSQDLKTGIGSLLSVRDIQVLDEANLKCKLDSLWKAMVEGASNRVLISRQIRGVFDISADVAIKLAPCFEKYNPFKSTLVDMLLQHLDTIKGQTVCFFDGNKLQSFKVVSAEKAGGPRSAPKFVLKGSNGEVATLELIKEGENTQVNHVEWKHKVNHKLSDIYRNLEQDCPLQVEVKLVHRTFDKASDVLPDGVYKITKRRFDQEYVNPKKKQLTGPNDHSETQQGGSHEEKEKGWLWKQYDGVKQVVFGPAWVEEVAFASCDKGIAYLRSLDGKPKKLYLERDETMHKYEFSSMNYYNFPIKHQYDFSIRELVECYQASKVDTISFKLDKNHQSKVYLTRFTPTTSEKISNDLQQRSATQLRIINCLADKKELHDIFSFLVREGREYCFDGTDKELYSLMYDVVDTDANLQALLMELCRFDGISYRSKEEALLLFKLIHDANIKQLSPDVELAEDPQLVEMLGNSLDHADSLKNKRGMILIGGTGAGKSTTTAFLMGLKMKTAENRFGDLNVDIDQEATEDLPKLGFSLGISKTTFAKGFSLLSASEEEGEGRYAEEVAVEFPPHIDSNSFTIVDFPGFADTRGTAFETVTGFSVDHSIKAMKAIDAVGVVIAYDAITTNRSALFIGALRDLVSRFPGCTCDPDIAARMFILVTKQPAHVNEDILKARAVQMLEEEMGRGNPNMEKCTLIKFFIKQCDSGRLILINPLMRLDRIAILNKVMESAQPVNALEKQTLKHHYQMSLGGPYLKTLFADNVNRVVGLWSNRILPTFLSVSKKDFEYKSDRLFQTNDCLDKKQQELEVNIRTQRAIARIVGENERMVAKLEQELKGKATRLPQQLLDSITQNQKDRTAAVLKQISECQKKIEEAQLKLDKYGSKIKKSQQEIDKNIPKIEKFNSDIEETKSGAEERELHNESYKEGDLVYSNNYKAGIDLDAKRRRAIDRGTDELSGDESDYELSTNTLSKKFNLRGIAKIDRDYRLVPSGQGISELNELVDGKRRLALGQGGYQIHVEGEKIRFDYIRHHRDGKTICYGYIQEFDGCAPYPRLIITHTIPKSALYLSEVDTWKDEICQLQGINRGLEEMKEKDRVFYGRYKKEKSKFEKDLAQALSDQKRLEKEAREQTISELVVGYKKAVDDNKKQLEGNKKKEAELKIDIPRIKTEIEKCKSDIIAAQLRRQRWALYVDHHRQQLGHALQMAHFYVEANRDEKGGDAVSDKLVRISKVCKKFLEFYKKNEELLETEVEATLKQPKVENQ